MPGMFVATERVHKLSLARQFWHKTFCRL